MQTLNALDLAEKIRQRNLSALEVTQHTLEKITTDSNNCFMSITPESALAAAAAVDAQLQRGICPSPLAGVPIAIDDTLLVRNTRCTAGSRMLNNFIPPFSATVVEKIRVAGLIPVGRTNTDEFGVRGSGDTCWHGPTLHPRENAALASGAAAAIVSNLVPLALCCDSIGTQRKFASLTGTVFLKPTYGNVSRFGVVATLSSAEQVGTAAITIDDAAALFNIIAGNDPQDGTSLSDTTSLTVTPRTDLRGMRIGVAADYWRAGHWQTSLEKDEIALAKQADTLRDTVQRLTDLGAVVQEYTLPLSPTEPLGLAHLVLEVLTAAEGCNNFSRYDGIKFGCRPQTYTSLDDIYFASRSDGFGYEVKKSILLGSYVLAQQQYEKYYLQALKVRRLIQQHVSQTLQSCDCLLLPAASGQSYRQNNAAANARLSFSDTFYTAPATLSGFPAAVAPGCSASNTEPGGIQLVANSRGEQILYDVLSALANSR